MGSAEATHLLRPQLSEASAAAIPVRRFNEPGTLYNAGHHVILGVREAGYQ